MSDIYDPPLDYDFGLDFDYSVWTMDSQVDFLNVPWDATYRHVVRFEDGTEGLNAFIDQNTQSRITISQMSYIKPGVPIYVDIRHNIANQFNYIRVRNQVQPGGPDIQKDFFYFITGVEYVAPDTTAIYVQLDVWQTYVYDVQFGNCYIERGHIGIANENAFRNYGRDYLTVPEGLDVGSEMRIITRRKEKVMGFTPNPDPNNPYPFENFSIVVVATQDLSADPYDSGGKPRVVTARGSQAERIASGAGLYAFKTPAEYVAWMQNNSNESWRTQSIQAAYIVPDLRRYDSQWQWNQQANSAYDMSYFNMYPRKLPMFPNWRDSNEIRSILGDRYKNLLKFLTFPYMAIEMTNWVATPIILKPESWNSPNADVLERATMNPPAQRIEFIPRFYNSQPGAPVDNWIDLPTNSLPWYQQGVGDDGGDWLDLATRIANFPSVPIVNNAGVAYLAANYSSIHQAYQAADWSQTRALTGNQLSFDQSAEASKYNDYRDRTTRQLMAEMTGIGNQRTINSTNINTASALASGLVGTSSSMQGGVGGFNPMALLGNGISAIAANVQAGADIRSNNDALASNMLASQNNTLDNRAQESYMRDTNKDYADFAAKGDYAQTIAALDAKVRDAAMMQPTMSGQYGGETINLVNNTVDLSIRWKMIDNSAMATVGEFWLQFGYAVHRSVKSLPADLMVMEKFTYWKLQNTFLRTGPMPEPFRQTLRGIMEGGTTVWRRPEDIGFTDFADNAPLKGITL